MKQSISAATRRCIGLCLLAGLFTACQAPALAPIDPLPLPAEPAAVIKAREAPLSSTVTPMPYEEVLRLFDYDRTEALDYREIGVVDMGDAQVRDISYASPNGGQVSAFLVTPPGNGPFAAIIFLHRGGSNRRYFLDEALKYAKLGALSLLLNDNFGPTGRARDSK